MLGVEGVQVMVGVGVGTGVGLLQGRVLRPWIERARRWVGATVLGLAAPFLVADVLRAVAAVPYALPVCVVLGGLLVGWLQARVLEPHAPRPARWIAASVAGWSAAGAAVVLSDVLKDALPTGVAGLACILALWLSGGVVLGLVGGSTLSWLLGRR